MLCPEHHFLAHYPGLIKAYGPLVVLWTMHFNTAEHSFCKGIVRKTNCFPTDQLNCKRLICTDQSSLPQIRCRTHMVEYHIQWLEQEMTESSKAYGTFQFQLTDWILTEECCGTYMLHVCLVNELKLMNKICKLMNKMCKLMICKNVHSI